MRSTKLVGSNIHSWSVFANDIANYACIGERGDTEVARIKEDVDIIPELVENARNVDKTKARPFKLLQASAEFLVES